MEKPITITIEDSREYGLLLEMHRRGYCASLSNDKNKCTVRVTTEGRKFLNKLINPIKPNAK